MDDEDVGVLLLAIYASAKIQDKMKKQARTRFIWVKPHLAKRKKKSVFQLLKDFRLNDVEEYRCYLRTNSD